MAKKEELTIEEKLQAALIPKEEQPYEIPDSWVWGYMFFAFAECLDKYRKPVNSAERANRIGKIPYYGATGQVGWIDDFLTDDELVLVGEDGAPFLDLLKNKAYMIQGKAWVNNHAHILKSFYGHFGNLYLLNYLNIFDFSKYVNGTTRLKLTQSKLAEIPIPIPPKKEQQRIVEKIDSLFEKTKKAKELIQEVKEEIEMRKISILNKAFRGELTKNWRRENKTGSVLELLQEIQNEKIKKWEEECREAEKNGSKKPKKIKVSKLEEMIVPKEEEPYKIPDTWKWVKLEEIFEIERGGSPRPIGEFLSNEEDAINWIKIGDTIKENKYIYSTKEKIKKEGKCKSRYVKAGDLLLTNSMSFGQAYILKCDGCIHDGWLVLGKKCKKILEEFYYYFLTTSYVYRKFSETAKGSTVKNLNKELVKPLAVVLIPLEEQQEIVRVLEEVLEKEKKVKELIDLEEKIDLLEKSILDKAFRGKLGTQDKNDEPALELLRKIWE
ncbi:type I restriction modification DNA specificity domain protein [Fusobacterium necrophorum subsp. funduliforme ATCC 51357]|uniref:Restriction endonuclease subunit S n=1 Tax=Fusobacterium necrophorum subsp. funduliforme TaxID=143387 RepID=A0A170MUZ3_9FUSO|nr:restriction endonuclease subunit S [Fusobacterium necrophorum]EIJ67104.1 type I restriction modification DNA specificity domain protein [Fusobacterium necrophorum subsp. funduliforme ATCC 51357]AYV93430.1 restriction endonuclease subunit S [Fusobacterium necrophorum subsp. funduliforme]KAB0552768.1 restriction endonuclease subunit S [Fusobacterium necrophorum subsp. funduliforme]KYL03059.1 restriction endonuclease subunit S [Fusobacterium necrophorum subsp. funduliforme]KYM42892.1 restricti